MNKYLKDTLHFCNLSYYSNNWIRQNLKKGINLNNYELKSINFVKKNELNVNISNKLDLGLPNILHCKKEKILFISFPGIRSNNDKFNCLNFKLNYNIYLNCNVHKGFSSIFYKLKDEIDLLLNIHNDINEIVFSGHSLGGAIAKIFALYCKLHYNFKVYCYTFACPLIGDNSFANTLNNNLSNTFTLCCEKDFLIRIPSWRTCNENRKYMIHNNSLVKYVNLTNYYLYNFLKLAAESHRLYYYIDFIENNRFDLEI